MKVTGKGEYADLVSRYIQTGFPKVATFSKDSLLEVLTDIMIGTKDKRYGPIPKPESQVVIRETLRRAIQMDASIPILVPWGGRKMNPLLSLDVAEVSAIKQLLCVDETIRSVFSPGLHIHMRVEDLNAQWLYKTDEGIEDYSSGMVKLIKILKGDSHIEVLRESSMMRIDDYLKTSEDYAYLLEDVLTALEAMPSLNVHDIPAYKELLKRGWRGELPKEQRDYYLDRYKRLYPESTSADRINKLADYLAGSKARYDLDGRGEPDSAVGSFIQINFAHPVPGAPSSIFNNTLYYRTVPESMGRTHIAPWRAKGYLKIVGNEVHAKVAHSMQELPNLHSSSVRIIDEKSATFVRVDADYMVEDVISATGLYI